MRYLTKSRFKIGMDCPTKLFYTSKSKLYGDKSLDDSFLKALAEGGFQVGELAKYYYPDGIEIEGLDYETTWNATQEHLKKENVILYEAALKAGNLFVRVDILKKTGNLIEIIEVKSKSFKASTFMTDIWQKRNPNKLDSKWTSYIYDVAFQTYVAKAAFPNFDYKSFLMCADKEKVATVDGLNQKFLIKKLSARETKIEIMGDVSPTALGESILTAVDISDVIAKIHNNTEQSEKYKTLGFKETIDFFASKYENDEMITPEVNPSCKKCQFRYEGNELKSGFKECWNLSHGLTSEELEKPFTFDIWFSPKVPADRIFIEDIQIGDFEEKPNDNGDGLSRSQRQWLQVNSIKEKNTTEYKDKNGIDRLFSTFKYPLHFIDFETCTVAIPFYKNRKPYEQVAFQFSHHVIQENGEVEHLGEWIEATPGKFPNFDFVRALKSQLENDEGTIFRYSHHENTVLNQIKVQLRNSNEQDRNELIEWIESITINKEEKIFGSRNMVDLCDIVQKFYYHPETNGSNSIKAVFPAILKAQGKNDPYKELPLVFDIYDRETLDLLMSDEELANGGAAMTAYALMQFGAMTDEERKKIKEALLRYCKLDTEAMVEIYKYLNQ